MQKNTNETLKNSGQNVHKNTNEKSRNSGQNVQNNIYEILMSRTVNVAQLNEAFNNLITTLCNNIY